jgi:CHAD domain-containing protein
MRVAGRRLRVALPLTARKPDGKRLPRALRILRELTRTAGASRDLDVSLQLLEERLQALPERTAGQVTLRRRLQAARTRSRGRMADALMDLEIARLRRDLRRIVARTGEDLFTVLLRLREMRESEGAAMVEGFETIGDRFDPAALHRLRRQARRLRYAAEVSDVLRGEPSDAPVLLKGLQEEIGQIHDRNLLAVWFEAQARASHARGQADLARAAEAEHAFFMEAARERHRAFLARGPVGVAREALTAMTRPRSAA